MPNRSAQTAVLVSVIILGLGFVFLLSNAMEAARVDAKIDAGADDEDLYLSSQRIKALSGDFNGLTADWYWINSLQYIGRRVLKAKEEGTLDVGDLRPLNPKLLYPMLDRTTTLDPNYRVAYTFGAVVLPAVDEELAIKLTEKGIAENPNEWRLYQHLGYIYWKRGDYEKAAQTYYMGSTIADAPSFMKQMSAKVRLEGGKRETAREIYTQIYQGAEDTQTRELIGMRLLQLDSLDERDAIKKALDDFRAKNGRCANSWGEVFGILRSVKLPSGKGLVFMQPNLPADPTGVPYILENTDGRCDVSLDPVNSNIPKG
jgi:tetratricopeptide (TPR) repeat protein